MPRAKPDRKSPYSRGHLHLVQEFKGDGTLKSPNYYIQWYDPDAGRMRSTSTGTAELEYAKAELDRHWQKVAGHHVAFCHACGQSIAADATYLVTEAIDLYWTRAGSHRSSATSIRARLDHVLNWLEATGNADLTCALVRNSLVEEFRRWSQAQPIFYRRKDGTITGQRQRSIATTEESLHALRAALSFAASEGKISRVPNFKTKQRKEVSQPIVARLTIEDLARMLAYAAEPNKKRGALHALLVAGVTTIARPDAIYDLSVDPKRRQWDRRSNILNLNPHGRIQTRKYRPFVGIPTQLASWLQQTADDPRSNGWFVSYDGGPVHDVDSAWDSMLEELNLPIQSDYKSYIVRRSVSTILRNLDQIGGPMVSYKELSEQMGHSRQDTTDIYASPIIGPRSSIQKGLQWMLDKIEELEPTAFRRASQADHGKAKL